MSSTSPPMSPTTPSQRRRHRPRDVDAFILLQQPNIDGGVEAPLPPTEDLLVFRGVSEYNNNCHDHHSLLQQHQSLEQQQAVKAEYDSGPPSPSIVSGEYPQLSQTMDLLQFYPDAIDIVCRRLTTHKKNITTTTTTNNDDNDEDDDMGSCSFCPPSVSTVTCADPFPPPDILLWPNEKKKHRESEDGTTNAGDHRPTTPPTLSTTPPNRSRRRRVLLLYYCLGIGTVLAIAAGAFVTTVHLTQPATSAAAVDPKPTDVAAAAPPNNTNNNNGNTEEDNDDDTANGGVDPPPEAAPLTNSPATVTPTPPTTGPAAAAGPNPTTPADPTPMAPPRTTPSTILVTRQPVVVKQVLSGNNTATTDAPTPPPPPPLLFSASHTVTWGQVSTCDTANASSFMSSATPFVANNNDDDDTESSSSNFTSVVDITIACTAAAGGEEAAANDDDAAATIRVDHTLNAFCEPIWTNALLVSGGGRPQSVACRIQHPSSEDQDITSAVAAVIVTCSSPSKAKIQAIAAQVPARSVSNCTNSTTKTRRRLRRNRQDQQVTTNNNSSSSNGVVSVSANEGAASFVQVGRFCQSSASSSDSNASSEWLLWNQVYECDKAQQRIVIAEDGSLWNGTSPTVDSFNNGTTTTSSKLSAAALRTQSYCYSARPPCVVDKPVSSCSTNSSNFFGCMNTTKNVSSSSPKTCSLQLAELETHNFDPRSTCYYSSTDPGAPTLAAMKRIISQSFAANQLIDLIAQELK